MCTRRRVHCLRSMAVTTDIRISPSVYRPAARASTGGALRPRRRQSARAIPVPALVREDVGMTSLPESYIDSMPSDPDLLTDLGRVTWAAARLHAGVRDAINRHHGTSSDSPFKRTLGQAISDLDELAVHAGRTDLTTWVSQIGRPASQRRNAVIHAVTFTAEDGRQALGTVDHSTPGRFLAPEIREVTLSLINASMTLPV